MRYIWQHITTIADRYDGSAPLTHFLKSYYRSHPKLGSRDRKILSEMAYCWYRCGKAIPQNTDREQQIKLAIFLCDTTVPQIITFLPEDWKEHKAATVQEKITFLQQLGITLDLTLLTAHIATAIRGLDIADYAASLLRQPDLFIRSSQKDEQKTEALLKEHGIAWRKLSLFANVSTYALPNGAAIDKILPAEMYVVQDLSSQKTGVYFAPKEGESWWDCCSGAGGKSLLLKALEPKLNLTVSDRRETILHNLQRRFHQYQLRQPDMVVADMADRQQLDKALGKASFHQIICDVPCTGSGTWARTPEQLYFFRQETIKEYAALQLKIALNAAERLKPGGTMYYITCSIFAQENDEVVAEILKETGLTLQEQSLINGIEERADSMFIAVLRKP